MQLLNAQKTSYCFMPLSVEVPRVNRDTRKKPSLLGTSVSRMKTSGKIFQKKTKQSYYATRETQARNRLATINVDPLVVVEL